MANGQGRGQGRGPGEAPGQQQEHEISRVNPETGEEETRNVTQQEWRESGKQLRDEGWSRGEDDEGEGEEVFEVEVEE